jgi:hypothetical protein
MRRVVESTLISADGVIGEPHLWTGKNFGDKAVAHSLERLGLHLKLSLARPPIPCRRQKPPTEGQRWATERFDVLEWAWREPS